MDTIDRIKGLSKCELQRILLCALVTIQLEQGENTLDETLSNEMEMATWVQSQHPASLQDWLPWLHIFMGASEPAEE